MEESPKSRAELFLGQLAFARPPVPHGVNQRQEFVQRGVFPGGLRHGLVQRLERNATYLAFGVRPDGGRSPSTICAARGGAACAVGMPRVASPRWAGNAYFTPWNLAS